MEANIETNQTDYLLDREVLFSLENLRSTVNFLKAISHQGRLMLLCHLATAEKSVGELEVLLESRQSAVSQQLARLRMEGLVKTRREGRTIYYALADSKIKPTIEYVCEMYRSKID